MKKVLNIFLFVLVISAGSVISTEVKSQSVDVNFSVFYNSLKPYGRWMNNSSYGQVWVSNTREFTPYSTGGHWAYTDYGWTWVSDYDWGWATFHYGRWSYNSQYGWYWVPGYEWAPAWVAWRNSNDYSGWAPLSPGLDISIGVSAYNSIPSGRWVFAPTRYITSPNINRYYVPRTQNVTIIKRTNIVNNVSVRNNVRYVAGPRREDVERVTHTKIQTYTISNSSRAGRTVVNKNTINVYRPVINNKTVVNNNKTTVNKNSNNTTVNKNSNNTVNKNSNNKTVTKNNTKNSTVNKNSNNNNNNKTKNNTANKTTNNTTNQTVNKKPQQNKKPATNPPTVNKKPANNPQNNNQTNNNKQRVKQAAQNSNAKAKQQAKKQVAKKTGPDSSQK
ncbi:MAG TPA: DUF6600 domain-containing protein [Parafilimonas sp.]